MEKFDWLDILKLGRGEEFQKTIETTREWKPLSERALICLNDVVAEIVKWLFYPYIALGKLTLLEGDPGVGKSWIVLAIIVAVSVGKDLFGETLFPPGKALLLSAEDGLEDTIKPRLQSMGGNHNLIFAYKAPTVFNDDGLRTLEELVSKVRPSLVVIDPLVAYLGGEVDMHRANETRQVMSALADIATKYNCAILAVRHLTKGGKDKAIYRGMGSIDFVAASRSVLLAGCDPEDKSKRAIVHIKSNLARLGEAIGYGIDEGKFLWTGPSDLTATRILSAEAPEQASAMDEAKEFLLKKLEEGQVLSREVVDEAKELGLSPKTIQRAKKKLGITSEREGTAGKKGSGRWYLKFIKGGLGDKGGPTTQPPTSNTPAQEPACSPSTPSEKEAPHLDGQPSHAETLTILTPDGQQNADTPLSTNEITDRVEENVPSTDQEETEEEPLPIPLTPNPLNGTHTIHLSEDHYDNI